MNEKRSDHDPDRDRDPDQDNANTSTPTTAGGSLAALQALTTALNKVDLSSVRGHSGLPLMLFKSREGGIWQFGQKRTEAEEGARWAINPMTFQWGWVCFGDGNKKLDEVLVPLTKDKPDATKLPDKGYPWTEQWAVQMKCLDGADASVEVTFKTNTGGGIRAVAGLVDEVRVRLDAGQHDGHVVPIKLLERSSYQHPEHGRIYDPVFTDAGWMPLEGPAPAPAPAPKPAPASPAGTAADQPRRRRVA